MGAFATQPPPRPPDATLTVTKAARLLGVHPNTIRAWSDQGRLRFYRINARGDRRYRLGDLQRFLAAAEQPAPGRGRRGAAGLPRPRALPSIGADVVELRTRPTERPGFAGLTGDVEPFAEADPAAEPGGAGTSPRFARPPLGSVDAERRTLEIAALGRLADLVASGRPLAETAAAATDLLHLRAGHDLAVVFERHDRRLVPFAASGAGTDHVGWVADRDALPGRALVAPGPISETITMEVDWLAIGSHLPYRTAVAIPGAGSPWGVLVTADDAPPAYLTETETFLTAMSRQLGLAVHAERLRAETAAQVHRTEALRRIAIDIGSRIDLAEILGRVVDHARVLFGGDRAAVFLRRADGRVSAEVSRGLSAGYLAAIREFPPGSLSAEAMAARRPLYASRFRDDPRSVTSRSAVIQEGFDTLCVAPLLDGDTILGLVAVYHDQPREWSEEELDTLAGLTAQAATAIKNAQNYEKMATWAAHLQSIQQLGARLARLTTESEIGAAIANELDELITYHNVRVYRLVEDDWLVPVAMRGLVGEFIDETPEQLRIRLGEGITGWVAANRVPQNLPDAANDPRAVTVPGTEDDLDESMLLAPLVYEDEVLGVIVLSKLGLHQFSDDDLRLLVIYASLAAQAIANAEATERLRAQSVRLERRAVGQRALLEISGSILETRQLQSILGKVTEHLADLVHWDNISIEWVEPATGLLTPLVARGVHADEFLKAWEPGETGLAPWVVEHGVPQLVRDELADPRIRQFASTGPVEGSIICVPLHGLDGVRGVLSLERLGTENRYDDEDFELVQLFATQVSIAIRNAEAYRAKEIEAETDDLTGLLNQGTFVDWLQRRVTAAEPFGLVVLDLDQFKNINDNHGHQAGDDVLRAVAGAIRGACRAGDLVFRWGGDEFTVICPAADAAGVLAAAERIQAAIGRLGAARLPTGAAPIAASIGVATFPEYGPSADEVLLAADRACFAAKRRGRNQVATAEDGLALAGDLTLQAPTPFDPPHPLEERRGT